MALFLDVLIITETQEQAELINARNDDGVRAVVYGTQLSGIRTKHLVSSYSLVSGDRLVSLNWGKGKSVDELSDYEIYALGTVSPPRKSGKTFRPHIVRADGRLI